MEVYGPEKIILAMNLILYTFWFLSNHHVLPASWPILNLEVHPRSWLRPLSYLLAPFSSASLMETFVHSLVQTKLIEIQIAVIAKFCFLVFAYHLYYKSVSRPTTDIINQDNAIYFRFWNGLYLMPPHPAGVAVALRYKLPDNREQCLLVLLDHRCYLAYPGCTSS